MTTTNSNRSDPIARRVLILGLDGATWDVLDPLIDDGRMPALREIVRGGAAGTLRSTVPPITPAAWTTFMTGRSPGAHGIIDFERYNPRTNQLAFNSTNALRHVRTLWQMIGEHGRQVGSINVPMTYPPVAVNGFMISGFEAVSTESDFAYPADLKSEILARWPDYSFKNKWRRRIGGGDRLFIDNLNDITRTFEQGADVLIHCGDRYGWDVLMIVYKMVDNLQHKVWRHLDPRTRDRWPKRRALVEEAFVKLDQAIARLSDYAARNDAHIFLMSDHGHGSLEGKIQPNLLLRDWGYLHIRSDAAQSQTRIRQAIAKLFRRKGKFAAGNFSLEDDLAVDFSRTRAAVMHAGMAGFLYLNLKGRQETGIVEPADYESLRNELRERLISATTVDPSGATIPLFEAVHKPEKLYGCEREGRDHLPDLMLCPTPRLAVVRKIRGRQPVKWIPLHDMEGTHRAEGVFAVHGPGVRAGARVDTDLVNSTPTILAMLGLPVPKDLEGQVINDAFDPPLNVEFETVARPEMQPASGSDASVYSAADMAKLTERLVDLGYLE